MKVILRSGLVALFVSALTPAMARAQLFRPVLPPPVPVVPPCGCIAQPIAQTTLEPVIGTTYQPRQVTLYQDVPRTEIRREAVTAAVPVTTHEQVTTDEGNYQMVWVPKLVTRTVPRTTLVQQTEYRDVAYTTTQRVATTHTQFVPQQTLHYVPQTRIIGSTWVPTVTAVPVTSVASPMTATAPGIGAGISPSPDPRFAEQVRPHSAPSTSHRAQSVNAEDAAPPYSPGPVRASSNRAAPTAATVQRVIQK